MGHTHTPKPPAPAPVSPHPGFYSSTGWGGPGGQGACPRERQDVWERFLCPLPQRAHCFPRGRAMWVDEWGPHVGRERGRPRGRWGGDRGPGDGQALS